MPAELIDAPLAVRFSFPGGRSWSARLDGLPHPRLALDLAHGMVMCFHPYGRANATHTARHYVVALRNLVRALAEAGFSGPAGELTRPMLLRYWMSHSSDLELATRGLLCGFDAATGALRPEVREHLSGRAIHANRKNGSYQPYTHAEWARLTGCCQHDVAHSWDRHQAVLAGAGRADDPRTAGVSQDSLGWLMVRHGPLDIGEVKEHLRGQVSTLRRNDPAGREGFDAQVRAAEHDQLVTLRLMRHQLLRACGALLFRHGARSVALHPVGLVLVTALAVASFLGARRGSLRWKGRPLPARAVRAGG